MANSEYKTVKANVESEIEIRKSVFIASVSRAETADEAEDFVRAIKKRFPDATHNCYAYTAGVECPSVRFSDDGEPGGTAGQPMLEFLKKKGLSNVAVVVTRYFGGIKLGAGGLVSAYTESVAQAVEKAGVVTMVRCELYSVRADYSNFSRIDSALTRVGGVKREVVYSDAVEATYAVKEDLTEKFVCALGEAGAGEVAPVAVGSLYLPSDEAAAF